MLKALIPKDRPKSVLKRTERWWTLSLDSRKLPPDIEINHISKAKIQIFGKTVLNMNFNVAAYEMESFDTTVWYFVAVWVPFDFLDDELRIEIEPIHIEDSMDLRSFLANPPA